jgi:hypothetical protein
MNGGRCRCKKHKETIVVIVNVKIILNEWFLVGVDVKIIINEWW